MRRAVVLLLLFATTTVRAQPEFDPADLTQAETAEPPVDLSPTHVDRASCLPLDLTPGALLRDSVPAEGKLATPIAWTDFEVRGRLLEAPEVVKALLEPTLLQYRTSLSAQTLPELAVMTSRFGYQLVGQTTQDTKLILSLAPLPLVRKVDTDITDQSFFAKVLDDEIKRRMSIRRGSYLPWDPIRRQCAMLEEQQRIEQYLFDEGYFDAQVKIYPVPLGIQYADVRATITLHEKYGIGKVTIACPPGAERRKGRCYDTLTGALDELPLSDSALRGIFKHERCFIDALNFLCSGDDFSRSRYQEDIKTVRDRLQTLGYPGVRIQASDPSSTIDRTTRTVNPIISIDPRRRVEVEFVGIDRDVFSESSLRARLTFNAAGSADDVEAADSAKALTDYLQTRGYFDARVTWARERIDQEPRPNTNEVAVHFDRVRFVIDTGSPRRVASVEFVGNTAISSDTLRALVATKVANVGGSLFGATAAATSAELILDQERIKEEYRRAGYADTKVWPSASVTKSGLDNAALTAALLGVDSGNQLHVRFTIEEGEPTLLTRITVAGENGEIDDVLCADVLAELSDELGDRQIARRSDKDKCASTISGLKFRYDDAAGTRDRLRDYLLRAGRARAEVDYVAVPFGINRMEARYTIKKPERLKLGRIIIRGAIRTKLTLIRSELHLKPGEPLTTDSLAGGARRLRNTGLFEAVNIDLPDLDCENQERACNSDTINAVVRVEERYIQRAEVGLEGGYSSLNGAFGTLRWTQANLLGRGILFRFAGTFGTKLSEAEGTLRLPQWLARKWFRVPRDYAFSTELTGLYRQQETERFGELTTKGLTLGLSRQWARPRTETDVANTKGIGLAYEFRVRIRNVDSLRPIGADMDESQVAISTRVGSVRINAEWDQRVDRNGQLAPLSPEAGFRLDGSIAYASPAFLGQDRFLKVSLGASKFIPIGKNLVLRADARYDHGFPFGGAVLLPEVERFFAGGDSTVRGYAEDRLKTEVIQVAVPPLDNVSQIRVIPAGGNIRSLASVDAQVRIWKILAGAGFADAGLVTNSWSTVTTDDIRPSVGMGLRALTPFGIGALEYAVPIRPGLGDDPRGRIHFYFAARAQF
jgi:outer membrane protein assembly factor BamA